MPNEDEKLARLREQLREQAITLAMEGKWREAVAVNEEIIGSFPKDVEAYNRMGRAYLELGEFHQAKDSYGKTLELDRYNAIAKKNLQRLSYLKANKVVKTAADKEQGAVAPRHFIEEIGKTGVVNLYDLAPKEALASVVAGDKVNLRVNGLNLIVEDIHGSYLGKVEPRHAQRLIKLISGGNKYSATVVRSDQAVMTVIIRETYRDPSQAGHSAFPSKGLDEVRPFVTDKILRTESDYEDEGESGYTIVGGEEVEVLPEEANGDDDSNGDED